MGKALEGVRILDMTHVQSGPSCTQMLGFLGADVIKLEPPGRGDITREQLRDIPNVDSLYFTMLNCNKRSITLNMKSAHGTEIFTELLKTSDVLVENFGPGVLDRFGFPWETIQQINPRVIYASIKGFGSYGPNSGLKAYESIAQAMGGSMSTTGLEDGPPLCTGSQIGDTGSGIHMVAAILAALYHRTQSGRGQRVEVAMQDSVLNLVRVKMRDHQRLQESMFFNRGAQFKQFGIILPENPAWLAWIRHNTFNSNQQNTVFIHTRGLLCGHDFRRARYQSVQPPPQPKFLLSHELLPPPPTYDRRRLLERRDHSQGLTAQNWGPRSNERCG